MARCREPVVNGSTDPAPLDRRVARPMMTGDKQDDAIPASDCPFEGDIDCRPCGVESQAVQVHDPVRRNRPGSKLAIPTPVEGLFRQRRRPCNTGRRGSCGLDGAMRPDDLYCSIGNGLNVIVVARQRLDCRRYTRPQRRFFRAERAHGPQRPWAAATRRAPRPTCPRRYASPLRRRPNRYRRGSHP